MTDIFGLKLSYWVGVTLKDRWIDLIFRNFRWSKFSAQTGHVRRPKQVIIGAMYGAYNGRDRTFQLSFPVTGCGSHNMWTSIFIKKNIYIFVVSGIVLDFIVSPRLYLINSVYRSNGFIHLELLLIDDTKLIPLNTRHMFFFMIFGLACWCWGLIMWY